MIYLVAAIIIIAVMMIVFEIQHTAEKGDLKERAANAESSLNEYIERNVERFSRFDSRLESVEEDLDKFDPRQVGNFFELMGTFNDPADKLNEFEYDLKVIREKKAALDEEENALFVRRSFYRGLPYNSETKPVEWNLFVALQNELKNDY